VWRGFFWWGVLAAARAVLRFPAARHRTALRFCTRQLGFALAHSQQHSQLPQSVCGHSIRVLSCRPPDGSLSPRSFPPGKLLSLKLATWAGWDVIGCRLDLASWPGCQFLRRFSSLMLSSGFPAAGLVIRNFWTKLSWVGLCPKLSSNLCQLYAKYYDQILPCG
jgi:hypothetical protein